MHHTFKKQKQNLSLFPAQYGQLFQEQLRASRHGLKQCMAAPVQLGFQHHQRESSEAAQEQPARSTQGDYDDASTPYV